MAREPVLGGGSVIREIAPNDGMVTPRYPETYFHWGASAVRCIDLAMQAVGAEPPARILDLPCGHGRVLRTLKATFPDAALTACDIDRDGVDFCAATFAAEGVYSSDRLEEVELAGEFDLIWVGSLFTHLSSERWSEFLEFLADRLAPNGLLVFTTHGSWYAEGIREDRSVLKVPRGPDLEMLAEYDESGFGYVDYPGQAGYGLSLSSTSYVTACLRELPALRLVLYLERGWRGHQDVVACQRGFTTPDK
jgi:SAM-dependent methyltransferase